MADKQPDISKVSDETLDRLHGALNAERQRRGAPPDIAWGHLSPSDFERAKNIEISKAERAAREAARQSAAARDKGD